MNMALYRVVDVNRNVHTVQALDALSALAAVPDSLTVKLIVDDG
ncbi:MULTISPECIES: hypothetical protein [Mycolicibacterium]|nr:hypothetical protein [Mycolicibacterium fortuitum]